MRRRLFVGFSTYRSPLEKKSGWTLTDLELVKRDLMNHFHTRRGERVMMPEFGCIIWDYLMEPLDDNNREIIVDEVKRIVESDSRVIADQIDVREIEYGMVINVVLFYRPWEVYESFSIDFDRRALEQA